MKKRTVFLVSDQTGVTVEALGQSLLSQFEGFEFHQVTVPFVDSVDKARTLASLIEDKAEQEGERPLVFTSLVQDDVREQLLEVPALVLDFFEAFLSPLERELGTKSLHEYGRGHGRAQDPVYEARIAATDFAIACDDGNGIRNYGKADLILVGVSRSGKTPTCLYLALQHGIFVANYPLTGPDLDDRRLPKVLEPYRHKLYGLTITPERLQQIRLERRARGTYASPQQVSYELRSAEALFKRNGIPSQDTTQSSIEEIAAKILNDAGLEGRIRV
ncbi:MAG: pyruvate, water dikinase regulatory protein [Gammaproteobacteria bacterium]|jgi:regulator of PEP synthase PpsR (kinase-PPPase family)